MPGHRSKDQELAQLVNSISVDPEELLTPDLKRPAALLAAIRSGKPTAEQISGLDDEVQRSIARTVGLRTYRNSLLPISRLPPELISEVLLYYILDPSQSDNFRAKLQWTKVSEVCRSWRAICLKLQEGWSHLKIDYGLPLRRLKAQVERAGTCPLSLRVEYMVDLGDVCDLLFEQDSAMAIRPESFCSLNFNANAIHVDYWLQKFGSLGYPNLVSLSLKGNNSSDEPNADVLRIPDSLLLTSPRLRELDLRDVAINFDIVRELTVLTFRITDIRLFEPHGELFRPPQIVQALSRCPGLRSLDLSLIHGSYLGLDSLWNIPLPSFEHLALFGLLPDIIALLGCIVIPSRATMCLYPQMLEHADDASPLMLQLRRHTRAIGLDEQPPTIHSLAVDCSSAYTTFHASTDPSRTAPQLLEPPLYLTVNSHPENEPQRRAILKKFIDALPSDTITTFDGTCIQDHVTSSTWKMVLLSLSSLNRIILAIDSTTAEHFFATLHEFLDQGKSLPGLTTLVLSVQHLEFSSWRGSNHSQKERAKSNFAEFGRYLQRRKKGRNKFENLELVGGVVAWMEVKGELGTENVCRLLKGEYKEDGKVVEWDPKQMNRWKRKQRQFRLAEGREITDDLLSEPEDLSD